MRGHSSSALVERGAQHDELNRRTEGFLGLLGTSNESYQARTDAPGCGWRGADLRFDYSTADVAAASLDQLINAREQ